MDRIALSLGWGLLFACCAQADLINIQNRSFEDPTLCKGLNAKYPDITACVMAGMNLSSSVTGWSISPAVGVAAIYVPSLAQYGSSIGSINTAASALDGVKQSAFSIGGGLLYQKIATIAPNTVYALDALVGAPFTLATDPSHPNVFGSWAIYLSPGSPGGGFGAALALAAGQICPTLPCAANAFGTGIPFGTYSMETVHDSNNPTKVYESPASGPLIGQPLYVLLESKRIFW
jgi:hypothetical protein